MGKILIIAEKPSVAKEIARVVGSTKRVIPGKDARYGYLEGNKYIVSWCFGHLVRAYYPEEYKEEYKSWDIAYLPIIPSVWKYSTDGSGSQQYKVLKKLLNASEVDSVICATDADREGELIFRLGYNEAKSKKPVQRLWISSMEESAIKAGMHKLKPGSEYDSLYYAADARQKADWIVGLNSTRYFTTRYSSGGNVLTIGRVQTPTVNLIVQRQEEIDNFKPQPYYVLTANTGKFKAQHKEKDKALAELKLAKSNGRDGYISSILKESKRSMPPLLYDLTHLQQDADKRFGYSATQTLNIVQCLYEKKLLTYPRTDSQYLSSDMSETAESVVDGLLASDIGISAIHNAFDGKKPAINKVINDKKVSGHHAIIPTLTSTKADLASLNVQEKNIFRLVALRLLAAVCVPQEYLSTKVVLEISGIDYVATGKQILKGGWMDIIACLQNTVSQKQDNESEDEEEQMLPDLSEGDRFPNVSVACKEKFTKPPAPYTEASLLKDMQNISKRIEDAELKDIMSSVDDNGNKKMLGTAATQGAIIDKIIKTGYISKNGRKLMPTEKAFSLMKIVPDEIKSPEMTAEWEKRLEEIKDGRTSSDLFMDAIDRFVHEVIASAQKDFAVKNVSSESFSVPVKTFGQCPLCGHDVVKNKFGNFSCSGWKAGCKFTVFSTVAGKKLTESQVEALLKKGRTGLIKGFRSKSGKAFDAYLIMQSDGKTKFEFKN